MGTQGNLAAVRQMARELADWFLPHALPADLLHGCGGSSCHTPNSTAEAVPA